MDALVQASEYEHALAPKKSLPGSLLKEPRLMFYMVGGVVILLAAASYLSDQRISDLLRWVEQIFGISYALIYGALLGAGVFAWGRLSRPNDRAFWFELGCQAAGGIATLSLTFTLLGISLGVGSLSEKTIDVDSIQTIIQEITRHFSTAFMTTVVGLPTANMLRAALALRKVKLDQTQQTRHKLLLGETP